MWWRQSTLAVEKEHRRQVQAALDFDTDQHYRHERETWERKRRAEQRNEVEVAAQVPGQKA